MSQFIARYIASKTDPWLGRITNGRVSWGMFNVRSATLKTRGAKTGQLRETQLAYFHDGRDVIVIGGDRHPQWYHNLVAHPDCELNADAFRATEVTDPGEYEHLRAKTAQVGRTIPVFRLSLR